MSGKDEKGDSDRRTADDLKNIIEDAQKELERLANKMDKVSKRVIEKTPDTAKDAGRRLGNIADAVMKDVREDAPKIQAEIDRMAKRMRQYADDIGKAGKR